MYHKCLPPPVAQLDEVKPSLLSALSRAATSLCNHYRLPLPCLRTQQQSFDPWMNIDARVGVICTTVTPRNRGASNFKVQTSTCMTLV